MTPTRPTLTTLTTVAAPARPALLVLGTATSECRGGGAQNDVGGFGK